MSAAPESVATPTSTRSVGDAQTAQLLVAILRGRSLAFPIEAAADRLARDGHHDLAARLLDAYRSAVACWPSPQDLRTWVYDVASSALDAHTPEGEDYRARTRICACGHVSALDVVADRTEHLVRVVVDALCGATPPVTEAATGLAVERPRPGDGEDRQPAASTAGYRHWHIPGLDAGDVRIQTGDQVLGREGTPGAWVRNTGNLASLDAEGLGRLALAATAAAELAHD